ncbi:SDR family NAD(P)-dependent oxidoreductase [uncultured Paraglaciecola sp.]|jgi:NAD(P)-dependent dehydrogenase (short-subunit alcohol dehydrogenase family)|uniref:SDR family NAD(P)-dependent oxidoreductase n=1 Tax=uncultured Paraglaciecola sp. TaxID=1765024 RepID=UPI0025F73C4B|nr:SDR family NAD(P)-dependent oxidoreductase [uncultured Paraglaciecola sp.]
MTIRYDNQVAIVTGAGAGLGRSHALALAARGAKVVVNDLAATDGTLSEGSLAVVAEIEKAGGEAIANGANVANMEQVQTMVDQTMEKWGRIDILVNNAGILRDKSFANMPIEDFKLVIDVHLIGSANCSKAVWGIMKQQNYGRIVMTTSSSGLYGNFGQANYGAAKMAVVGLMNTLCIEGQKNNIQVNCLSPTARTAMTEELIKDKRVLELMTVESVTTGLLALVANNAPNRTILGCGAGGYARAVIKETDGIYLSPEQQTPENLLASWDTLEDQTNAEELKAGWMQTNKYVAKAAASLGVDLSPK